MGQRISVKLNNWVIYLGIIWSVAFSGMSFYWAMGGRLGVKSLGGEIYEISLNPSASFLAVVWFTGIMKLLGAGLLLLLFFHRNNPIINRKLFYTVKIAGAFLFLYGALNFLTISLHALNMLKYELDHYATFWRLAFWEPYWMAGGIFYFFSVKEHPVNRLIWEIGCLLVLPKEMILPAKGVSV